MGGKNIVLIDTLCLDFYGNKVYNKHIQNKGKTNNSPLSKLAIFFMTFTNLENRLSGYTSSCGRPFEMLPDEEVIIDGFNFTSTWGSLCSYIVFITTKRIIFKQGRVSYNGRAAESAFHADVRFVMLEDIEAFKFIRNPINPFSFNMTIEGNIRDFSVAEKRGADAFETGMVTPGFGMSASLLWNELCEEMSAAAEVFDFPVFFSGNKQHHSTMTAERANRVRNIALRDRAVLVGGGCVAFAALIGGLAFFSPNANDAPSPALSGVVEQVRRS